MSELIMDEYIDYLENEKELTSNTLEAYKRDIVQFKNYLVKNKIDGLISVNKTVIITYLMTLQKEGKATSTISRNLASIRCFYQYLLNSNFIDEDPTLNLRSPKCQRKLPHILTKGEVNLLLSQPSEGNFKGSRDKAMLELLYATGIRVSEIVALDLDKLSLELGYLYLDDSNLNKRAIPIGSVALKYLGDYIEKYRNEVLREEGEKALFLNYNGSRLSRQGFWKIIKQYAMKLKLDKKNNTPPYTKTFFCSPSIAKWCRYKSGTGNARSFRYFYYPDVFLCN